MPLARRLLLTGPGHRALVALWYGAGIVALAIAAGTRGAENALSLSVPLAVAPLWARWCLRRGAPA